MSKLVKFITDNKITIKCKRVDRNPHMKNSEREMDNWKVTIKMNGKQFSIFYSMGFGQMGKEPTLKLVLETLQADLSLIQNGYEDYLSNLGEEDTREDRKAFEHEERQEEKLKQFFGEKFEEFRDMES
jgi:hypothetical protein